RVVQIVPLCARERRPVTGAGLDIRETRQRPELAAVGAARVHRRLVAQPPIQRIRIGLQLERVIFKVGVHTHCSPHLAASGAQTVSQTSYQPGRTRGRRRGPGWDAPQLVVATAGGDAPPTYARRRFRTSVETPEIGTLTACDR